MSGKIDYDIIFRKQLGLILILKPDENFTIVDATDAHLVATLTKREEICGKYLFSVFPENPDAAGGAGSLKNSLQKAISNRTKHVMPLLKYDIKLESGLFEERYWLVQNTPVMNENNEVLYVINQVEDVTERVLLENKKALADTEIERKSKLIEENAERINRILSVLLSYTTMDFSERLTYSDRCDELDAVAAGLNSLIDELEAHTLLLKEANATLEYTNNELDSFSYSVSHDLRAPLRAINGYSQMLIEDYQEKLDDEGKHIIQVIIKNAARMGALIDDLLTFSRIGKQALNMVPLNMETLVNSVIHDLSATYKGNPITWNIKTLAYAEGDGSMMNQVLTNLISNAIKYSSKREQLVIEIGSYPENGRIVFYVKDNGAGFDMRYYDKLFGVFQRLHSASEFEGTGVGLALVQRILKKHRGAIWATAEPEQGATFYFSLPDKNL